MNFTTLQTALTLCIDIAFLWGAIIVTVGILDLATRNCFTRSIDYKAMKLMAVKPKELPAAIEPAIAAFEDTYDQYQNAFQELAIAVPEPIMISAINPHDGYLFDDFLKEEGIYEEIVKSAEQKVEQYTSLLEMTSTQLKAIAKKQKVKGWGSMTKAQLIAAIAE